MEEKKSKQLEQNKHEKPMSFITMVVLTGLIGGILWSSIGLLAYVFNFTDVRPNLILEPWALGSWKKGWIGTVFSIVIIGVLSIGASLIYYALLRRFNNLWVGMAYGIGLFLLVFYILNPIFPGMESFWKLSRNTLITTGCIYILYGVFIGYSISFEEAERKAIDDNPTESPA